MYMGVEKEEEKYLDLASNACRAFALHTDRHMPFCGVRAVPAVPAYALNLPFPPNPSPSDH